MRTHRRDLLLGAGFVIFLAAAVWSAVFVTTRAVNQLLLEDAEATGEAWTRYLAANVKDLEAIVAGVSPSAASLAFFEKAQKVGDVFLYKIFDAKGALKLVSNQLDMVGRATEAIAVHNPEAAEVVLEGETEVEAKEGTSPDRPDFYSEAYVPVIVGGKVIGIVETYLDQSGKRAAFHAKIAGVALSLAGIIAVAFGAPAIGFYLRTRQQRQSNSRLEFLAHHDPLTEILNRTRFMHDLDEAITLGCPIAVHIVDINGFKDLNDTLGQPTGDEILRQVARRLQTISEKENLLARLGGDDFALAEIVRNPRQITTTARRIVSALGETFHTNGREAELTASVGSAVAPAHGEDAAELLKSAEIALFNAKSEGRGTRSLFRPEMDAELRARRELEARIRDALANQAFELHFQPILKASNKRLSGFEALLRFPKGDGSHISPALFVPLAERLGLIGEIGDFVIRRACATAATWPSKLSIAVNLSPVQFADGRIAERVSEALSDTGLDPRRLELEITEGLLLSDTDAVMRQLADLKALGVRIAMDDFGTGYSSLSYLWKFPFDKLKIDQSFARALGGTESHIASVIDAIVALGKSLGMRINAEGVETEAQAEFLVKVGCDELQGFHFGRPMPIERVPAVILADFRSAIPHEERRGGEDRRAREA